MNFNNLGLIEPILKALKEKGYNAPTPIQYQSIPAILEGKDIIGCAQTGTGKTAAFALPIIQLLAQDTSTKKNKNPKALVITPTRELCIQIHTNFEYYSRHVSLRSGIVYGGVSYNNQATLIKKGVDILVATPGRLLDLINQKDLSIRDIEYLVLDEADSMLDMGFIHDIKKIIAHIPKQRQTILYSATMPQKIRKFANSILRNAVEVNVDPVSSTAEKVEQKVFFLEKNEKLDHLIELLKDKTIKQSLIFTRTKYGADKLAKKLSRKGINTAAIHGNKSQNARQRSLTDFASGKTRILIATDIAARGIDISQLSHVINYDLPQDSETYVHRIGRTGRAGEQGVALSFCSTEERKILTNIQKLIGFKLQVAKS